MAIEKEEKSAKEMIRKEYLKLIYLDEKLSKLIKQ